VEAADSGTAKSTITLLLESARSGNEEALPELFDRVYSLLHDMAGRIRGRWANDATLGTTALVHEAYLKIAGGQSVDWEGRSHFLGVAAKAMRHILTDHARRRNASKRGGGLPDASINDTHAGLADRLAVAEGDIDSLIGLDRALDRLAEVAQRESRVVECRFYAGLSVNETAAVLDISPTTVKRDWAWAQAWLYRELHGRT
jgi:RNA polymerase sigma factor (TIGR02999 family)